jgi:hypothetical protein
MRFCYRAGNISDLGAAIAVERATHANAVALVRADLVAAEWDTNLAGVLNEASSHAHRVDDDMRRLCDCEDLLQPGSAPVVPSFANRSVRDALRVLSESLLSRGLELEVDGGMRERAYSRQVQGKGPGKKGKDCQKDCPIAEGLLDLARAFSTSSSAPFVFLTSNKTDFYDAAGGPHLDLAPDFSALGIQLCATWGFAKHSAAF